MRKLSILLVIILTIVSCEADSELVEYVQESNTIELIFPENNLECTEGVIISDTQSELTFKWNDSNNAPYTLNLTNIITSETRFIENDNKETELTIIVDRGTPYSWNIVGKSNSQSDTWAFYNEGPGIESYIPFAATAISPASGVSITETNTTTNLVWNTEDLDNDIIGFDLYFGLDKDPILLLENIKESEYTNIPISSGNTYYWKIVTKDSVGNESTSDTFSFTVD